MGPDSRPRGPRLMFIVLVGLLNLAPSLAKRRSGANFLAPDQQVEAAANVSSRGGSDQLPDEVRTALRAANLTEAAKNPQQFCDVFCYHHYFLDLEGTRHLGRWPCKQGCFRSFSQGSMGYCTCEPTGTNKALCHDFPYHGGIDDWEKNCEELYPLERNKNACIEGWTCGYVMSSCHADAMALTQKPFEMSATPEEFQKYCSPLSKAAA